jgi:tripartite motif-containing protein 71
MNPFRQFLMLILPATLAFVGFVVLLAVPAMADSPVPAFSTAWGTYGSGAGNFHSPFGIALDNNGNVYVVDEMNDRVQKFTHKGQFLLEWGGTGSAPGQFSAPTGIAVDNAGVVYVTDTDNNRIQKFDATGGFISQWGTAGSGDGQFQFPRGIAVDNAGGALYVVDQHNHRIQKFNLTGDFLLAWGVYDPPDGTRGDPGEFDLPTGVALDSGGRVYVTDTYNNRVQKFSSGGSFLGQWGTAGNGSGQFNYPTGIAIDPADNVYVADSNNHRIQQFDTAGIYQSRWGTFGSGNGQFFTPGGVATGGPGEVYVADTANHRVQKFGGLWLTKRATTPAAGEQMTYTIRVGNDSPITATGAVVSDTLSSNLQFAGPVQLFPPQAGAIVATSALSLPILAGNVSIPPLSYLTITLPVTVNGGLPDLTAIINTAAVTSSEFVVASQGTAVAIIGPKRTFLPIVIK